MTTFEVTRDEVVFAVGEPVSFDVVPVVTAFTVQPGPGADGTSFTPRGPWDSGDTYAVGDVVSFDGGNYILYATPPTGGDPDVDTAHWDVFGSSSVPDGTTSVKGIVQLEDSHTSTSTTKAATPKNVKEAYDLAAAAQPADSDLTAIAGATLTGDGYLKRASSVWSLDTPSGGGGGSLPSPTGEVGAVLGVDESETYALQRYIQYGDGDAYAIAAVQTDRVRLEAADGLGGIAGVNVYMDGSVGIEATAETTVTGPTTFLSQEGSGRTTLNGEDFQGERADNSNPEAATARVTTRMRGTLDTPAAVVDGDTLDVPLYAQGHDGTDAVPAAQITAEVDGTVATGKVPARVRIATADADGVLTDRMIIGADGTTDVLGDFTVNGSPVSGGGGGGGRTLFTSAGPNLWSAPANGTVYAKGWAAGGGGGSNGANYGGGGGYFYGEIAVSAGDVLAIMVGSAGRRGIGSTQGVKPTYGGGGAANSGNSDYAGSGGGYVAVFRDGVIDQAHWIVGAGGGGGSGNNYNGGPGGGSSGGSGGSGGTSPGGGTSSAGGAGDASWGGSSGSALTGGDGESGWGSGGGGGYYGGGGGGENPGSISGGGGGSGYADSTYVDNETLTAGSGATPGNSSDTDRFLNAGAGGTVGVDGGPSLAIFDFVAAP